MKSDGSSILSIILILYILSNVVGRDSNIYRRHVHNAGPLGAGVSQIPNGKESASCGQRHCLLLGTLGATGSLPAHATFGNTHFGSALAGKQPVAPGLLI